LSARTSGITSSASDPRLKPAAHEFEACLMKEFLEPLQHDSLFADEKDGDSGAETGEDSENALMSFGSEALAKAISERGGFGIASKIIGHFENAKKTAVKASTEI
jgi:flagellar protein FlgJ